MLGWPQNPHTDPRSQAVRSPVWASKASGFQCDVTHVSDRRTPGALASEAVTSHKEKG